MKALWRKSCPQLCPGGWGPRPGCILGALIPEGLGPGRSGVRVGVILHVTEARLPSWPGLGDMKDGTGSGQTPRPSQRCTPSLGCPGSTCVGSQGAGPESKGRPVGQGKGRVPEAACPGKGACLSAKPSLRVSGGHSTVVTHQ